MNTYWYKILKKCHKQQKIQVYIWYMIASHCNPPTKDTSSVFHIIRVHCNRVTVSGWLKGLACPPLTR